MICAAVGVTVMRRGCIPKAGLFHRTDCEVAVLRYLVLSLGCDGCRQVIERVIPFVYTSPLKYITVTSISSPKLLLIRMAPSKVTVDVEGADVADKCHDAVMSVPGR